MIPQWESIEKPELYLPEDATSATEADGAGGRNSAGSESPLHLQYIYLYRKQGLTPLQVGGYELGLIRIHFGIITFSSKQRLKDILAESSFNAFKTF